MVRITFSGSDILFDKESLVRFIATKEIVAFMQTARSSFYEIYILYADGFWWRETFEKPAAGASAMRSSYETAEGKSGEETYTRSRS